MPKQTPSRLSPVVVALVATTLAWPLAAAPSDDANSTSEPPLVRAEKSLRELGTKAKDTASEITSYALSLIGVDYKFGGNTPEQGLDCSGLIRYVFQQATGMSLPRTARDQARVGDAVSIDKLQPGDLVFFNTRRFQFSRWPVHRRQPLHPRAKLWRVGAGCEPRKSVLAKSVQRRATRD